MVDRSRSRCYFVSSPLEESGVLRAVGEGAADVGVHWMFGRFRYSFVTCVALLCALSGAACREIEPPRSYDRDLGTDGAPLPPTSLTWLEPKVKDGRAQWHPFREPTKGQPDATAGAGTVAGNDEIQTQLREMLVEYNKILSEERYDELPDFFVESQADAAEKLMQTFPALLGKFRELNETLPEPDLQFTKLLDAMSPQTAFRLEVEAIEVVSRSEATGRLKPMPGPFAASPGDAGRQVRFVQGEDDYWYFDLPALAAITPRLQAFQQQADMLDQLIAGIKSGQVPGDIVAEQLGSQLKVLKQWEQGGEADGPTQANGRDSGADESKRTTADAPAATGG